MVSEPFRFNNHDPFFSMVFEIFYCSSPPPLLALTPQRQSSWLPHAEPIDYSSAPPFWPLNHPLSYSVHTTSPFSNIASFIFFPIFPSSFILHRNPNLRIFISVLFRNIQNLDKPIDLLQRFIFRIWAPHWPLCQPSCRRPSRQNWLLRLMWRLFRLQHCLCPLL